MRLSYRFEELQPIVHWQSWKEVAQMQKAMGPAHGRDSLYVLLGLSGVCGNGLKRRGL